MKALSIDLKIPVLKVGLNLIGFDRIGMFWRWWNIFWWISFVLLDSIFFFWQPHADIDCDFFMSFIFLNLFACFVDFAKANDLVSRDKLRKVLQEYGVDGQVLRASKSFYCRPEIYVRVNSKQSRPFHVGVGLRQRCVLSPFLFIVYTNWNDKCNQADKYATIWKLQNQSSAIRWWFDSAFFYRIWPPARNK